MAFDTLTYARRLKQAGFSEEQAEALAEATRGMVVHDIVTKDYLETALERLSPRLTVRMGTIAGLAVGLLAAIIKL